MSATLETNLSVDKTLQARPTLEVQASEELDLPLTHHRIKRSKLPTLSQNPTTRKTNSGTRVPKEDKAAKTTAIISTTEE